MIAATAAAQPVIPPPPSDPALAGLLVALDGDAMAEILGRRLPDCSRGELAVRSCRARYIRYKPGTNCLVQYELTLDGQEPGPMCIPAHIRLYADRHAQVIWAGRSLHRLVERARRFSGPPVERAALVPELKGLVELFPVDRKMRKLVRAVSPESVRPALLSTVSEPIGRPALAGIELVRYKPGRKAVLRYRIHGGSPRAVYGRVHADGRGAALLDAGRAFVAAGVRTPAPLAYSPELTLLLVDEAPGRRLADLPAGAYERWLPAVAEALAALHTTHVENLPVLTKRNKEGAVLAAARTLAAICPESGPLALRLGATLAAALAESAGARSAVHGDFYDDQVLVSDDGVALLDLDASGLGNPLLDVGNFLAHLAVRRGERARRLFLEAYGAARPDLLERTPLFEAAALLRLAISPFRRLSPDWPGEAQRRVELAAERLRDDSGSRRYSFAPTDARLPQLEILQDAARIAPELERLLQDGPVEVVQATVVRHKPGRRCLLRYEVRVGRDGARRRETLYGKAFVSGRGRQVHERLRAVAAAPVCGPRVSIPEPVGYIPSLKLLVQRDVAGDPAREPLLAGDTSLALQIADGLRALHGSSVELGRSHGLREELAPLDAGVERLAAAGIVLGVRARRCLELAHMHAERRWTWRRQPVHRDFYHDQVLVREEGLAILDWDDAAMSEPAVDVANFRAHLRLLALQRTGSPNALDNVSEAFAERYAQADGNLDPSLVRLLEGTTLLRLAAIHLPRARGEWLAEQLLQQSELLLAT